MKIAICGLSESEDKSIVKKAFKIGELLAKTRHIILTGGCYGYPYEASKGAFSEKGTVIAYSPAKTLAKHVNIYEYPADYITKFVFTGIGVPGRNFPLVMNSDAVIIVGGKAGTLIEFAIAFHEKKPIGVLTGSHGITKLSREIADICDRHGEKFKIVYGSKPVSLVEKLLRLL